MDEDLLLAIRLQQQFDDEYQRPLSVVDESWEMLDPSPDVRAMFLEFNDMFFWGKLSGVEVKWSPRMTLCAGVCSYEGRGGLCSIRLSEPLLKLRPRKDLVQTLLHEMIHALLFVTQNNRDRDGHGPEFCKHMSRINKASGANITVYHTFHDEVDLYRQHWWRCDGPCQNRKPYFGYVKRAMNRAPSALDPWWEDHKRSCGGTYTKVKEPEGYGKKGKMGSSKDKKNQEKKALGNGKPSSTTTGDEAILLDSHTLIVIKFAQGIPSALPSIRSEVSRGQKPPIKRSVSNTRVFVNISGSPVRIPKAQGSTSGQGSVQMYRGGADMSRTKQRSVQELFNSFKAANSSSTTSSSTAETKGEVPSSPKSGKNTLSASSPFSQQERNHSSSSPSTFGSSAGRANHSKYPSVVQTGSKSSPAKPMQSKYFSDSSSGSGAAGGGPVPKTRLWDGHSTSAPIFDYFQKTVGTESAAAGGSMRIKSPAVQQRPVTTTTTASSSASYSLPSSVSSSRSLLTVSCPVCQKEVQEAKINEHLDSCLT
uniref:DNA-dependent metalloprotease SPRTN n=1 Tax=Myripristis murdjan TaxID=586833 RepID=A0A668A6B9_9TELE